jgi:hypothetical protein
VIPDDDSERGDIRDDTARRRLPDDGLLVLRL